MTVALRYMGFGFLLFLLSGCVGTAVQRSGETAGGEESLFRIEDISKGLPTEGLWRQNVQLVDIRGDGSPVIITPPPRKAKPEKKRPFVFEWDDKKESWVEGNLRFPPLEDYGYGGIAVGDINNDGRLDIALAVHSGRIILLMNDGKGGFTEAPFPMPKDFRSRTIALADLNGDGLLDVIAFSEFPPLVQGNVPEEEQNQVNRDALHKPVGIVVGINKSGGEWDVRKVEGSDMLFGDSLALGNVTGGPVKDLLIAVYTTLETLSNKVLWTGDRNGNFSFKEHTTDALKGYLATSVKTGDIDGDGRDEAVFLLAPIEGSDSKMELKAYKWTGDTLKELPSHPELKSRPIAFSLFDIDGDGRQELIVLCEDGLHVYKYAEKGWSEIASRSIPSADTIGAYDLEVGKRSDGSVIVVYNLGHEFKNVNNGLRAFRMTKR